MEPPRDPLAALKSEFSAALRRLAETGWTRVEIAREIGHNPAQVGKAINYPSQVTIPMIRQAAAKRPDQFGWAADKLRSIEYPESGSCETGDERMRAALDVALPRLEEAIEALRTARRLL